MRTYDDALRRGRPLRRRALTACTAVLMAGIAVGWSAAAADAAPAFTVSTTKTPSSFRIGDRGDLYVANARNTGDQATPVGSPSSMKITLPPGVVPQVIVGTYGSTVATCSLQTLTCTGTGALAVGRDFRVSVSVRVNDEAVDGAPARVEVSGGAAQPVAVDDPLSILPRRPFGTEDFVAGTLDDTGAPEVVAKAGGHPFAARASFTLNSVTVPVGGGVGTGRRVPVENARTIITELPVGFTGNPRAAARCSVVQLQKLECPIESQVGWMEVDLSDTLTPSGVARVGVYNIEPARGNVAQFGAQITGIGVVRIAASVRTDSDYGVTLTVRNVPADPMPQSVNVVLWGTPADPRHDPDRFDCMSFFPGWCVPGAASSAPMVPFLSHPHRCLPEPPVTRLVLDSWLHPGQFKTFESQAAPVNGCDQPEFNPSAAVEPTVTAPDAPTGLGVDLGFPEGGLLEPAGLAPPPLKKAVVTLPEGMTINPGGASGLAACSDADLKLKSKDPVTCPDASKVGTVTAKSPVLEETLSGGVYIRSQNSRDPESGEMFRLALVLENKERGLSIRLPGEIRANRQTGRLETTFDNNPQLPVSDINLKFKDGPAAPLATPANCGPKTIDTVLTSWAGQTKTLQSTFNVDCVPHLGTFSLGFQAGTRDPVAGASSPFNLLLQRADGKDVINGLRLAMPEGLLANLNGNVGTQVGTVTADAGPGSQPYRFPGKVYLEGPYDDAPFSLRVVIPAKAGPFDLGEVVVRQKIYVDPITAQVTVVSDPIPTIVEGVPVRLRNMSVDIDKRGFMINPTSCAEKEIGAVATSLGGQSTNMKTRFQVGQCDKLPVKPKLDIDLVGKKQLSYLKHPGIKATVTQTPGEAGLRRVEVTMPLSLALDPKNAKALCKPAEADAKACPEGSIVGDATAISPVLNRPLKGKVYFVEGTRVTETGRVTATLPKLWVALRGEVALDVWADSDVKNRRLVNTFPRVPDAPISSFELNVYGGKNGILAVTGKKGAHLCKQANVADAKFDGQNGKRLNAATMMGTPCGFRAVSTTLESRDARVRMTGLRGGRLTVQGPGVKTTRRKIKRGPVATVRAPLSASGRRAYRARKSVRLKVTFRPSGGGKTQTKTVVVKRAKAKAKAKARGGSTR